MIDSKERGGFTLPDLQLYYEAACLCWLKEWIVLKNTHLLHLEGHDLKFGWHAYLWYGKAKIDKCFSIHVVRRKVYRVWEKYENLLERKTPLWLSPIEAIVWKRINMGRQDDIKRLIGFFRKGT